MPFVAKKKNKKMKHLCPFLHCPHPCESFFKMIQSDWDETNVASPAFIRNKPKKMLSQDDLDLLYNNIVSLIGDVNVYNNIGVSLLADLSFRYGVNNVTTLWELPVTKQSVVAALTSAAEQLSLDADLIPGQFINVCIEAVAVGTVITFPSSPLWQYMNPTPLELDAGVKAEINIWCVAPGRYEVKTNIEET